MNGPYLQRYLGSLVVARNEIDRNTPFGNPEQWFHGHFDECVRDYAPVEEVTSMDHQVNFPFKRRGESMFEVGKKIGTPAAALYPGFEGEVKT